METSIKEEKTSEKSKKKEKGFFSKMKEFITLKRIISFVVIAAVVFFGYRYFFTSSEEGVVNAKNYVEVSAKRDSIVQSIEESGVIEPFERYEITALARGEIIASPFEEGDYVNEGDTLYQIDDEDAQLTIERSQNTIDKNELSLNDINEDIANLKIYAPASGKLTNFTIKENDNIQGGSIGKIINNNTLTLDVSFSVNDHNKISVGDRATLTSALYMTSLEGTVTHMYDSNSGTGADGSVMKNVEITITNPGAIAENTTFAAIVHTLYGDVSSAGSGTINGGTVTDLKAQVSGTVSEIYVKNGDQVTEGQLLVVMTNESLMNNKKSSELSLRDSKLNMDSNRKTLENYHITAPISGTIITKNSKVGDKIDNSTAQTVMMVVADMSKMKFTITVDELDIMDIALGQTAIIDADALPEESFTATVTSIASEGVSTGNGVTTYDVELTIEEPGNLKPGMNVNANILIKEANDVIIIPEDALMGVRGTSATVLVKTENNAKNNNSAQKQNQNGAPNAPGNKPYDGNSSGFSAPGNRPESQESKGVTAENSTPDASKGTGVPSGENKFKAPGNGASPASQNGSKPSSGGARGGANIPEGCEMRTVEIGISNGQYTEIISGISEGEIIVYIPQTASSSNGFGGMFGSMHGGMMMGGMPSGGMMGGGMSGGMSGGNRGGMPARR